MGGKVIDFRLRPFTEHYKAANTEAQVYKFYRGFGYEPGPAATERTYEALVAELDEAAVAKAVIPGRGAAGTTNEELFAFAAQDPERYLVFPFLDITDVEGSLRVIDEEIVHGAGRGASFEALIGNDLRFDDERIFPIYQKLQDEGIPVMTTVSGWVAPFGSGLSSQIQNVVTTFPKLTLIAAHAGYPWLNEFVAIAFMAPNLILTADFEGARGVGNDALRIGALYQIPDQVIFASSFPFGPIAQGVQSVRDWHLPAEAEEKVLYGNAARILGL